MVKYIVKRLLTSIPIFLGITAMVFILSNMAPGSPADVIASSGQMSAEAYHALEVSLNLDKPVVVRYFLWLGDLLHGDLGMSTNSNQQVAYLISQRIGPSLILTGSAILASVLVSIPLGVLAACKPYSIWDNLSSAVSFIGVSTPNFFISLVLIYVFAVKLKLLPAQGMYSTGNKTFPSLLLHLLLPTLVLAIQLLGSFVKQTRGAVLEVLGEEYIKTARSKGIKESAVVTRHALRNAWIPIVTTIGMTVPFLIGGAVITEQIFGWPGIGSLMVVSVNNRDYNTIMGVTVLIAISVLVVNILLDVFYSFLDPRIKR